MELKLSEGRYAVRARTLDSVSGDEELAQRIMMKLTAHRGKFWPKPDYGSRLYLLINGERPSNRENAVRQYVAEALSDEKGVELKDISISQTASDAIFIKLKFAYSDGSFSVEIGGTN